LHLVGNLFLRLKCTSFYGAFYSLRPNSVNSKDFKGSSRGLIEVTTIPAFSGWTEENYESPLSIANFSAETQIRHLPNVSLERYHYTSLLGKDGDD